MKLSDICIINPKPSLIEDDADVSFVGMADVSEDGKMQTGTIRSYLEVKKGYTPFEEGDVLFAKITPCMENGKGALAVGLINGLGCGSTEFHVLRPFPQFADGKWLYYLTAWPSFRKNAALHMTGSAGQKRVPKSFLENYDLNVPELTVQKTQVQILDQVAAIKAARQKQLDALDELVKARFIEMFGDPVENPMKWEKHHLCTLCDKLTDGTHFSPKSFTEGDYKYVTAKNIKIHGFDFSSISYIPKEVHQEIYERCNPEKGDILYIKDGATTGIAMINPLEEEFSLLSSVALIKHNRQKLNGVFLHSLLNNDSFYDSMRNNMGGAAITRLTIAKLNNTPIIVPPLNLQCEFAKFADSVIATSSKIRESLAETETLFQSLMQEYFG